MISDDLLKMAAEAYAEAMNEVLPSPDACRHAFSPAFEKKMKRLIRKTNHPFYSRWYSKAACAMIAVVAAFAILICTVPSVRASMLSWTREQWPAWYRFSSAGIERADGSSQYCPGWLPEDCRLFDEYKDETGGGYYYEDREGYILSFLYMYPSEGSSLYFEGQDMTEEPVKINGRTGIYYAARNPEENDVIIWHNTSGEIMFFLTGHYDQNSMLRIAEKIKRIK